MEAVLNTPSSDPSVLRLEGVRATVPEGRASRTILDGIDLTVRAGEKVAVVGRSGAGKSSLLNIMGLIARPSSGEVWVRGVRCDAASAAVRAQRRARDIGFVFQSMNLIPHLTVAENVLLGVSVGERAEVGSVLESMGLEDAASRRAGRLSIGEQQRVAIARAVIKRPAVILADEPTGSLDERTESDVLALFDLAIASGTAVVAVTHSDRVAAWADGVLTLEGSALAERRAR